MRVEFAMAFVFALGMSSVSSNAADGLLTTADTGSWTGVYGGVNAGLGFGQDDLSYSANDEASAIMFQYPPSGGSPLSGNLSVEGLLGGLQAGYNWQVGDRWVTGLEADFQATNIDGTRRDEHELNSALDTFTSATEQLEAFGTFRARFGYLAKSNLLIYGTGGLAYGQVKLEGEYGVSDGNGAINSYPPYIFSCESEACFKGSDSEWALGWTAGAGVEYAVGSNWTLSGEYLYLHLPTDPLEAEATHGNSSIDVDFGDMNVNLFRFKANYGF